MSTLPLEYIKYSYFFMGAGGIEDSDSTNWKVMLDGNQMQKAHEERSKYYTFIYNYYNTMMHKINIELKELIYNKTIH